MLLRCKNFAGPLVGPVFVGAPVRPNVLNMPKSASGGTAELRAKGGKEGEEGEGTEIARQF